MGQSVGLGVRVPLVIVSPWTRGGWVNSQVFDHSSVIRFLETRFGVAEPNISPWRRAVTGDLTSMFDFADPDAAALGGFPATSDALARVVASSKQPAPHVPAVQGLPRQEPGQRPARALPYRLEVRAVADGRPGVALSFANSGKAAAVFSVYAAGGSAGPWFYTVEPGRTVVDRPPGLAPGIPVAVHAPNGFLREFAGDAGPEVVLEIPAGADMISIGLANRSTAPQQVTLRTLAYAAASAEEIVLAPGAVRTLRYPVAAADHWYDLVLEIAGSDWRRRCAGHVETGRPSRSDPAFGTA
jgi:phospholipase C